jgi:hypothetical protein
MSAIPPKREQLISDHAGPTSSGDDIEEVTPDPIPNSEVKLFGADGTAGETQWESRTSPGSFSKARSSRCEPFLFCRFGSMAAGAAAPTRGGPLESEALGRDRGAGPVRHGRDGAGAVVERHLDELDALERAGGEAGDDGLVHGDGAGVRCVDARGRVGVDEVFEEEDAALGVTARGEVGRERVQLDRAGGALREDEDDVVRLGAADGRIDGRGPGDVAERLIEGPVHVGAAGHPRRRGGGAGARSAGRRRGGRRSRARGGRGRARARGPASRAAGAGFVIAAARDRRGDHEGRTKRSKLVHDGSVSKRGAPGQGAWKSASGGGGGEGDRGNGVRAPAWLDPRGAPMDTPDAEHAAIGLGLPGG